MRVRVRVQSQIVIPGENRAISRGSREGDPGGDAILLLRPSIRHCPACPGNPFFSALEGQLGRPHRAGNDEWIKKYNHLGPLPLATLGAARRGMTGGATPPPYFFH